MPRPKTCFIEDASDDQQVSTKLRRLMILRLALAPLGFGMTVAAGVNLIVAMTRFFSGDNSQLRSLVPFFLVAGAFTALSAAAVPRIDRRILDLASRAPAKTTCLQMLNLAMGLPLGKNRKAMEAELARQLSEVDERWWTAHAKELREQVDAALELARHPSWMHPMDGPWVPALFQAITRCGRTEYIRAIESLLKRDKKKPLSRPIAEAAQASLESLLVRQKKDREAATLLRPTVSGNEQLLRPINSRSITDPALLLRVDDAIIDSDSSVTSFHSSSLSEDASQAITLRQDD